MISLREIRSEIRLTIDGLRDSYREADGFVSDPKILRSLHRLEAALWLLTKKNLRPAALAHLGPTQPLNRSNTLKPRTRPCHNRT